MDGTPHRVVDSIANGVANGVTGLINAAIGAVQGAGESVMKALDMPFTKVTGKEGPHRILDRAADGAVDAGRNFVEAGVIGTAKKAGEGIMHALDQPTEQIGIPPELGKFQIFNR
jgi:hypothetical protein